MLLILLALLTVIATSTTATEDRWYFRAAAGGQIDAAAHGVIDVGARKGPLALELFTDTVELRYAPEGELGRAWIAARGELGVAGLFPSPWTKGAPDPTRALTAHYLGLRGGAVAYLPWGIYAGLEGSALRWIFKGKDSTRIPVPEGRFVFSPAAVAGWWTEPFHLWVRAGADVDGGHVSPKISAEAILRPKLIVGPLIEARAGYAKDPTDITRTRLGGLNPYVVPLAGAGWAEFWVAKYAAIRAGPSVIIDDVRVALVIDAAAFDDTTAYGLAILAHITFGAFFVDVAGGYAPAIERASGTSRASAWALVGFDWAAL